MPPSAMPFPPNPDYGKGEARRAVRLEKPTGTIVTAHLIDNYHEMRVRLRHDRLLVTDVEGEMIRFPTTACPGAPPILRELIGMRLDTDRQVLSEPTRLRSNCTHLFDIAILSMRHALRDEMMRRYEAIVPDAIDVPVPIEVRCNGAIVHTWLVRDGHILSPGHLAGLPLLKGFSRWSPSRFDGDALEAATLLVKTCFIAMVRPYAPESSAGKPVQANVAMPGACYAYAPARMADAHYTNQVGEVPPRRDRSDTSPEI
jgi:hypothetical protein